VIRAGSKQDEEAHEAEQVEEEEKEEKEGGRRTAAYGTSSSARLPRRMSLASGSAQMEHLVCRSTVSFLSGLSALVGRRVAGGEAAATPPPSMGRARLCACNGPAKTL